MPPILRKLAVSAWILAAALVLGTWMWLSDFVTSQGERTIYTADCVGGQWQGAACTGALAAGQRYRFRALPPHREVLFWKVGSTEPSGRFTQCDIRDGRNWTCPPSDDAKRTITLSLQHGSATHDATGRTLAFHSLHKWRWLLLRAGLHAGGSADD